MGWSSHEAGPRRRGGTAQLGSFFSCVFFLIICLCKVRDIDMHYQPCVFLPPHLTAMSSFAVQNKRIAEVVLSSQHSASSCMRSVMCFVCGLEACHHRYIMQHTCHSFCFL